MKFTVSTKPLSDALNLSIVNQNVSKFYQKSGLAQITATHKDLTINLEAANILSEVRMKGSADSDTTCYIFVDCLLLKQLVSTFDSAVVTMEFVENGLILHSGKSKFTLSNMVPELEMTLKSPAIPDYTSPVIDIDKSDWKFIKDYQMYSIAMSFVHAVYTKVWIGESGDVIVGDFDNSLFTHSKKSKLGATCLLSDTIINLFNAIPEGAQLIKLGRSYLINVKTDGYEFISEFTPQYEADDGVGSYNSDIILETLEKDESTAVIVPRASINKFLSQADLFSASSESTIHLEVADGHLKLSDSNVDCSVDVEGNDQISYSIAFRTTILKSVISNFDEDHIYIAPSYQGEDVVGIIVWTKNLTAALAGEE